MAETDAGVKACCTLPAVVGGTYEPVGTWEETGDIKTYITGNKDAKNVVVYFYDAFGISPQVLQGADRLAKLVNGLVLLPDIMGDKALVEGDIPPVTDAQKAKVGAFWADFGDFSRMKDKAYEVTALYKSTYTDRKWAAIGLCWGGKVIAVSSVEGTPFDVTAQVHPGRLAKEDAEKIVIPHIVLASNGEAADVVAQYKEILGDKGYVTTYTESVHGWMGARADLEKEEDRKFFEKGYKEVGDYFLSHP